MLHTLIPALAAIVSSCTAIAADLQSFSLDTLKQTVATRQGNICISPHAAAMALSLLEPGASGKVHRQISGILGKKDDWKKPSEKTLLHIISASRVYIDTRLPLRPTYKAALPKGSVASCDFRQNPEQARADINRWVSETTQGMIPEALPTGSINAQTALNLVSVVYFNNKWVDPFPPAHPQTFTLDGGPEKDVPTMYLTHTYAYSITPHYQAIDIPYKPHPDKTGNKNGKPSKADRKNTGSMICILPPKGTTINQFVAALTPEKLQDIRQALQTSRNNVERLGDRSQLINLSLPKFKFSNSMEMLPVFAKSGLDAAFSDETGFTKILTGARPYQVTSILQNTAIEIDEKGTEAAAVISMPVAVGSSPGMPKIIDMHFDRPFLWLIVPDACTTDSLPLFMGIVREP